MRLGPACSIDEIGGRLAIISVTSRDEDLDEIDLHLQSKSGPIASVGFGFCSVTSK
jgi:hypothetical protein